MNKFVMYSNSKVDNTLKNQFMTPFLIQAQKDEFNYLQKIIQKQFKLLGSNLSILHIGIGDARVACWLKQSSVWKYINNIVGIDNSEMELKKAQENLKLHNISNTTLLHLDAIDLNKVNSVPNNSYDLVLCTYFTAGNFKPEEIELTKIGIKNYDPTCLQPNRKFIHIFHSAYQLLKPQGKIILGSTYINSEETRLKQEAFYKKCGMTVITSERDSFTATREGFWSQRFTIDQIYSYFPWTTKENITCISLDDYNFARMVIVSK